MAEPVLKLQKGIYTINNSDDKVKIVVNYAKKTYSYKVKGKDQKRLSDLIFYAAKFAVKMIESKSDRNFYDESLIK